MGEELDLRGEVCPYTFVKTKLALEQLHPGEMLRILVDHEPAVENVPRSVEMDGHSVLSMQRMGAECWEIVVQKASEAPTER